MREEILKKKAKGVVDREATESDFEEEHREKALKQLEEDIGKGKIKRFQDLKNRAKTILSQIAKEEGIEFYD